MTTIGRSARNLATTATPPLFLSCKQDSRKPAVRRIFRDHRCVLPMEASPDLASLKSDGVAWGQIDHGNCSDADMGLLEAGGKKKVFHDITAS